MLPRAVAPHAARGVRGRDRPAACGPARTTRRSTRWAASSSCSPAGCRRAARSCTHRKRRRSSRSSTPIPRRIKRLRVRLPRRGAAAPAAEAATPPEALHRAPDRRLAWRPRARALARWPGRRRGAGPGAAGSGGCARMRWPLLLWLSPARPDLAGGLRHRLGRRGRVFRAGALLDRRALPVDIARHGWMAPFALVFMAGGLGALLGRGASARAAPRRGPRASRVALALAGMARGHVLTGFPWALLGYIWIDTPRCQWRRSWRPARPDASPRSCSWPRWPVLARAARPGCLGALLALRRLGFRRLAPVAATAAGPRAPDRAPGPAERAAVGEMGPGPRREFYSPARLHRRRRPTRPRPRSSGPKPPSPYLLDVAEPDAGRDRRRRGRNARRRSASPARGRALDFNSLVVLDDAGSVAAALRQAPPRALRRIHPLRRPGLSTARPPGLRRPRATAIPPGPGARLLDLARPRPLLPLICYEAIFPAGRARRAPRADRLLQITNDAWFGTTGPTSISPRRGSAPSNRGCRWSASPTPASRR